MSSITIYLEDSNGNPLSGQTVRLRRAGASNFGTDVYSMSDVAGKPGSYKYDGGHVTDTYKVWVNGSEDASFGGGSGIDIIRLEDVILKSGGTMTGDINMDGHKITNLPDASSDGEPVKRGYGDTRYIRKEAVAGNQQVNSPIIFGGYPRKTTIATNLQHLINKQDMVDYVQTIISGLNPSAYQQSGNILRVIYNGTAEVNKVYKTIAAALTGAEGFASEDREMLIEIAGNGEGGVFDLNHNLLPAGTFDPYIHFFGKHRNIVTVVAEDTYLATAGKTIIANQTLDNVNEDAITDWENIIFINVHFTNSFTGGSPFHRFTSCAFYQCTGDTGFSFTGCKNEILHVGNNRRYLFGDIVVVNNLIEYGVINPSGDVIGRRILGRRGSDVASATNITLGAGNFFRVTGSTNIRRISKVDWTGGSRVVLYFTGNVTLTWGESNSGDNIGINFKDGLDLAFQPGDYVELMYDDVNNCWIELDKKLSP